MTEEHCKNIYSVSKQLKFQTFKIQFLDDINRALNELLARKLEYKEDLIRMREDIQNLRIKVKKVEQDIGDIFHPNHGFIKQIKCDVDKHNAKMRCELIKVEAMKFQSNLIKLTKYLTLREHTLYQK